MEGPQGHWWHEKNGLAECEIKDQVLFLSVSERAHKLVFTVKKSMHLIMILNSSTGALVTVVISIVPDGGFYSESMRSQMGPAHIPHIMLR